MPGIAFSFPMEDNMDTQKKVAVSMKNICKSFGSLHALNDVSLSVNYGEIHAVLGENGAGKSTLMSILFGMLSPDKGEIYVNGKPVRLKDANDATALKIGMVHQHFKLVNDFTVYENIVLGTEDTKLGVLTKRKSYRKIKEICHKYGINLSLDKKVRDISVGMQQRTEIVKVLYRDADILIFDEPTAVLTPQEIDSFIEILKNFKKEGKAIILITHKLDEIKKSSDVFTVLRKGETIGTYDVKTTSQETMASLMVGRQVNFKVDKTESHPKEVVLDVINLSCGLPHSKRKALENLSLSVRAGEIVAIAGIEGNGQQELIDIISGMKSYPQTKGAIHFYDIGIEGNFHELTKKEYEALQKEYDTYYEECYLAKSKYKKQLNSLSDEIDSLTEERDNCDKKDKKRLTSLIQKKKQERKELLSKNSRESAKALAEVNRRHKPVIEKLTKEFEKKKKAVVPVFEKNVKTFEKKTNTEEKRIHSTYQKEKDRLTKEIKVLQAEYKTAYSKAVKEAEIIYNNQKAKKEFTECSPQAKEILDRKAIREKVNEIFAPVDEIETKLKSDKTKLLDIKNQYRVDLIENRKNLRYLKNSRHQTNYVDILKSNIKKMRNHKLNIVPSDRQKDGLVMNFNIAYNLIVTMFAKRPYSKFGIISKSIMNENADRLIKEYDIRSSGGKATRVGDMSGGNQQKVILARETSTTPRLLIANQPTRGLDVGAIEFVNRLLVQKRDEGAAILLYSVELEDIMNLADRILVIHNGHISAELDPKKTSYEEIGLYMGGNQTKEEKQK